MNKVWFETKIVTVCDQSISIQPTEEMLDNQVVLECTELTTKQSFRIYLNQEETLVLIKNLQQFFNK